MVNGAPFDKLRVSGGALMAAILLSAHGEPVEPPRAWQTGAPFDKLRVSGCGSRRPSYSPLMVSLSNHVGGGAGEGARRRSQPWAKRSASRM